MKTLILMSAPPGCGKSTWSKRYLSSHPNTYILSSDETRKELTGVYDNFTRQKEVWELFEKKIKMYCEMKGDFTLILDALNDLDELRVKYFNMCKPYFDRMEMVCIYKSHEDVMKNNLSRDPIGYIDPAILEGLYSKYQKPSDEVKKLFDNVTEIVGYF